ncbi:hypothetical protein Tco_1178201 [Tanacetum coccineum]
MPVSQVKMEDITMEEYIQLKTKKDLKSGQVFDWKTDTYGKVEYFEDIDYIKDFETEFPVIVRKDASTSKPEVSSKPMVSPNQAKEVDFDFEISFTESDDEDYTFMDDKNAFSYK